MIGAGLNWLAALHEFSARDVCLPLLSCLPTSRPVQHEICQVGYASNLRSRRLKLWLTFSPPRKGNWIRNSFRNGERNIWTIRWVGEGSHRGTRRWSPRSWSHINGDIWYRRGKRNSKPLREPCTKPIGAPASRPCPMTRHRRMETTRRPVLILRQPRIKPQKNGRPPIRHTTRRRRPPGAAAASPRQDGAPSANRCVFPVRDSRPSQERTVAFWQRRSSTFLHRM